MKIILLAALLSVLAGCVTISGKANYFPMDPDRSSVEANFEVQVSHN